VGKLDGKVAVITGGASAGMGEQARLGEITEEQFRAAFWLNARGTLFTVQKTLSLLNDGAAGSKAVQQAWARVWLAELKDRRIRVNVLTPGQVATAKQEELFDEASPTAAPR
jgi:hypothetical protein